MSSSPIAPGSDVVLVHIPLRGPNSLEFNPLEFNSRNRHGNPCRGEVLRVGRKYVYVQGNERCPWRVLPAPTREAVTEAQSTMRKHDRAFVLCAVPVDLAKDMYREWLTENRRDAELVSKYVDEL